MNILSFNIREEGSILKRKRVSHLIRAGNFEFRFLQETKSSNFNDSLASAFWGNQDVDWSAKHSMRALGGMAILWSKSTDSFVVNFSFHGSGCIGINISWKGGVYDLVNIYAPYNAKDRRMLWSSLLASKPRIGHGE